MTNERSQSKEPTRAPNDAVHPLVDIFEDDQGITLLVDLPGVSKERLHLLVENDSLTIEGEADLELPEALRPLFAEVGSVHYRRSFSLSRELDTDNIGADFKNGVLTVTLPKRKEHQPRKITVTTA